ncbi:MAG: flagellar biosynthetic protein FliR [Alphaproteobacteria bacterium CG_4_9_14_3_um_filter_47_13]|nr:MAG: flagellar biosynthetic protein FliR [Alphaproteobacteria bacterium CG_4_9_14_3_um_filter_47_13]
MNFLEQFLVQGVFAFILTFVRIGAAVTIMPGVGDTFTPQRIRLYISLGLSLVLSPLIAPHLPNPVPVTAILLSLIVMEFIIGLFIGTIARILMVALDTAGMAISMMSGLGSAQIFNPAFSTQGSLVGAMFSVTGVLILFATNMHHLLFYGLIGSYELFPVGGIPDTGSMAELMSRAVAKSFLIGVEISAPFIVVSLLVYIGMGVLTRLMPQIQVFLLALPLQIILSLITLSLMLSAGMMFWVARFEEGMVFFLSGG